MNSRWFPAYIFLKTTLKWLSICVETPLSGRERVKSFWYGQEDCIRLFSLVKTQMLQRNLPSKIFFFFLEKIGQCDWFNIVLVMSRFVIVKWRRRPCGVKSVLITFIYSFLHFSSVFMFLDFFSFLLSGLNRWFKKKKKKTFLNRKVLTKFMNLFIANSTFQTYEFYD